MGSHMTPMNVTAQGHQTAVWMDGTEAKIFHILPGGFDESTLTAPKYHVQRHPKDWTRLHNHPDDEHHFFPALAKDLDGADHILIAGPSVTKLRFLRFLQDKEPGRRLEGRRPRNGRPSLGRAVRHARTCLFFWHAR